MKLLKIKPFMKKLFLLLAIAAIISTGNTGCKNKGKQGADSASVSITVDSFLASPEKWAGKDVVMMGTVSHICKHSGKKLFLFGADGEKTVKIYAGGDQATFDIKYEGTDIEITGTVIEDEKIDANYLKEWEAEIKESLADEDQKVCDAEKKAITGQTSDSATTKTEDEDPYAVLKEFRKKLEESGKTYISVYAINCKTLKALSTEAVTK
jgi:hypothetical protein